MIHTRYPLLVRPISIAALILIAGLSGCGATALDATKALDALDTVHVRLAQAAQEQAGLDRGLAATLTDIAAERVRLAILLDIDELLTPDGHADRSAIERLLRDGSDNAVVSEVRLGRLSLDEAVQLVSDAASVGHLSPDLRSTAEEQIVSRFNGWQHFAAMRAAILSGLEHQSEASSRLLDEAEQLTDAIRQASAARQTRTVRISAAAQGATQFIPDADLRDSIESLIDALLTRPSQPAVARSQDQ